MDKVISFIQPSRNTLKYLKWSYQSIRKNLGYIHEICMADDASTDGTWEWMNEIAEKDPNVKIHRNEGPERLGHTILYDTLINDYATNDIVMIFHSDMYACPNLDTEILKHLEPGTVVSATRIEPPLHPEGPEKIIKDFGIELDEFDEQGLLQFVSDFVGTREDETTNGVFAPWAIYKEDFQAVGGHDPLFAPQSKEDSDIFNRFVLAGYELIQTWKGFVYHMTCRGSRFKDGAVRNPEGQVFMKGRESDEWLKQNIRSTRNFIRKWGTMVMHDKFLKPIISPKYNIGLIIKNCKMSHIISLEPWCSVLYVDLKQEDINNYIQENQQETLYDLSKRVALLIDFDFLTAKDVDGESEITELTDLSGKSEDSSKGYWLSESTHQVLVEVDGSKLTDKHFEFIQTLPYIIEDTNDLGKFTYDIFDITINSLNQQEIY